MVVVEGMITDRPGPYTVNLSYSNDVDEPLSFVNKIQQASVVLFDDHGYTEALREVAPGTYQTRANGIQGIVGHQYHIVITLLDGSIYESEPETLLPVGNIKKVYYEFEQKVAITPDSIPPGNGFNVYIDADVAPGQDGRVRWITTGTYEIRTFPERRIIPIKYEPIFIFELDPPACSGYVVSRGKLVQIRPCECCHCWLYKYDPLPQLSETFFNSGEIKRHLLTFIPADKNIFFSKYHLKVEQMSLSKNVYEFWKTIKAQRKSSSDLFQTPTPRVGGNIVTGNSATRAIGYFAASSLRDTSFFITRDAMPYALPAIDTVTDTCLVGVRFGTTTKPPFWQ